CLLYIVELDALIMYGQQVVYLILCYQFFFWYTLTLLAFPAVRRVTEALLFQRGHRKGVFLLSTV
ncbi:hypothetical protein ACJX0J_010554, partial [Zea mays]